MCQKDFKCTITLKNLPSQLHLRFLHTYSGIVTLNLECCYDWSQQKKGLIRVVALKYR